MSSKDRNPQIFIAKLAPSINETELEYQFRKFGRIRNLRLMRGYAFVEYDDYRDAEDAIYEMDGKRLEGQRIIVQKARGKRRSQRDRNGMRGGSRSPPYQMRPRRPGPQETDVCYNCGKQGHWANECREPKKPKGKYFIDGEGNRRSKSKDSKRDLSSSRRSRSRSRSSSKSHSKERAHQEDIKEDVKREHKEDIKEDERKEHIEEINTINDIPKEKNDKEDNA